MPLPSWGMDYILIVLKKKQIIRYHDIIHPICFLSIFYPVETLLFCGVKSCNYL